MLYVECFKSLRQYRHSVVRHKSTLALVRSKSGVEATPGESCAIRNIVSSRHEWLVLYNYAKHLSTYRSEITRDKCTTLLISLLQLIQEQNKAKGWKQESPLGFICDKGVIFPSGKCYNVAVTDYVLQPSNLLRYMKLMAKIRPYYMLKRTPLSKEIVPEASQPMQLTKTRSKCSIYDELFSSLLEDNPINQVRSMDMKDSGSYIGPLRLDTDQLIAIPPVITTPFYFELSADEPPEEGDYENSKTKDSLQIVDHCVMDLLDHLLRFFDSSDLSNQQCILTMFLATMLYGPKLRTLGKDAIDDAFAKFHKVIVNRTIKNDCNISFRSLAYLLNSCTVATDLFKIGDYSAGRILQSDYVIPVDHLENICFALSRANYENDALYEHITRMILEQMDNITPTVCLNLLWSYTKVGNATMVLGPLEKKLQNFNKESFEGLNITFLKRAHRALKDHIADESFAAMKDFINGDSVE